MKTCPNCRFINDDSAIKCAQCDTAFAATTVSNNYVNSTQFAASPQKPRNKTVLIAIGIMALLVFSIILILAGIGISSLSKDKNTESETVSVVNSTSETNTTQAKQETLYDSTTQTSENNTVTSTQNYGKNYLKLNADLQYDVNIFLSNFSEADIENFSTRPSDKEMLNYAVTYNLLNKNYEFENCDVEFNNGSYGNLRIHKDKVLKTVKKYFGYQLDDSACYSSYNYYDNYFYTEFTGGSLYSGFCIVSSLEKLKNNRYRATFDVYIDGSDGSDYYGCSTKEIEKYDKNAELYLKKIRTGYAIIEADNIYDRSTYTLSAYYDENI